MEWCLKMLATLEIRQVLLFLKKYTEIGNFFYFYRLSHTTSSMDEFKVLTEFLKTKTLSLLLQKNEFI